MRTTPTPVPATRPRRTGSSRSPRPTTWSATPRSASSTTRCARCSPGAGASGGFGGFPGGFGGQTSGGSGGFDVSDLFGDLFNQGSGRSTGFGNRSPRSSPGQGSRHRGRDQPGLPERHRRHHHQHAPALGRTLPDLLGHGRQARHPAARLWHLRRRRHGGQLGRWRVLDERDLSRVPRPSAGLRRSMPDLSRVRSGVLRPLRLRADPGGGEGRPAHPAQGQGCGR